MAESNQDLQRRRDVAFARGLGNQLPVYVEKARNAEIWDVEGRRYIDFGSGIAVLNTGHLHPKVQAAVARQLDAGKTADPAAVRRTLAGLAEVLPDGTPLVEQLLLDNGDARVVRPARRRQPRTAAGWPSLCRTSRIT